MKVIYKISSPSGRVYIGQSRNVKERFKCYFKKKNKSQIQLYRSFTKYGIENHQFEIIHELPNDVEQSVFNDYERLYIDLYKSCRIVLLNIKEGGADGKHSEETLKKISFHKKGNKNMLGKKHSPETILRISQSRKGKGITWNKGLKWDDETKKKMSIARIGKEPWNKGLKGVSKASIETKVKMGESQKKKWDLLKSSGYTFKTGFNAANAKLNRKQVSEIRVMLADNNSVKVISDKFGVSRDCIRGIKSGKTYNN